MSLSRSAKILIAVLGVAFILAIWLIGAFNGFVGKEESVKTAWSQVETQYQRRLDLIPNLVESVKGVMTQEQEVFGKIAEARTRYASGATPEQKVAAANQMESALARLLVVMENYPQLRSTETVQSLMAQLEGTENRITVARERYNESVEGFNVMVRRFPGNILAAVFGFEGKTRFEAAEGAENAPKVDLKLTK